MIASTFVAVKMATPSDPQTINTFAIIRMNFVGIQPETWMIIVRHAFDYLEVRLDFATNTARRVRRAIRATPD